MNGDETLLTAAWDVITARNAVAWCAYREPQQRQADQIALQAALATLRTVAAQQAAGA